jgi:hypothetical protein
MCSGERKKDEEEVPGFSEGTSSFFFFFHPVVATEKVGKSIKLVRKLRV